MSGITTGTAIAIAGGLGAAGSVAGGVMGMNGAGQQADAAMQAAQLNYQAQEDALHFQEKQWNTQQLNIAPWLLAGKEGVAALGQLMGLGKDNGTGGFGSLMQPFSEQFQAPTAATEQNDPGYQFRLQQGQQALENSAAARGGLLNSGTAAQEQQFGQNYASNEYSNVHNRQMQEFANRYNIFENNQANQYNRLAGIAGVGQAANQQLGQFGSDASRNVANILYNGSQAIGGNLQNAAAARASGYTALGNAFGSGLGNLSQLLMMQNLFGGGGMNSVPGTPPLDMLLQLGEG